MVGILIADSNQLICSGLSTILHQHSDYQVVGEASSEDQMIQMIEAFHPDLALVDFTARDFSIDAIPRALRVYPHIRFVAITERQTGMTIVNALRAGVMSYIKKDCDIQEIVDSVRETLHGGRFFCGQILEVIRREAIDVNDLDNTEFTCDPVLISERELEIISLIAEGYTNNEIAEKLFLSPHTVNTHRKNIMQKLGVNNTAAIVMYAVKTHLVSPSQFLFNSAS